MVDRPGVHRCAPVGTSLRECALVYAGVWKCVGVYECVWDEFSEYVLENRVPTSADFNTYPIRIFTLNLEYIHKIALIMDSLHSRSACFICIQIFFNLVSMTEKPYRIFLFYAIDKGNIISLT